ncbi:hypothetical protein PINS_up008737 [Pythium insidiosum]|nr:hypothetical protein PINS_up008737 [Pythium insidiosum]
MTPPRPMDDDRQSDAGAVQPRARRTREPSEAMSARRKRVRWSTITIHEFGVAHGGSAVPKNGPSIGLSRRPEFTWSTPVGTMAKANDGVQRFTSAERVALLRDAGYEGDVITAFEREAADVRRSRELYQSAEMKLLRKKRRQCKAEARERERERVHSAPATSSGSASVTSAVPVVTPTSALRIPVEGTVVSAN